MGINGPPPTSQRQPNRSKGRTPRRILPAAGRPGPAPDWPLTGKAPSSWDYLWSLPQALAWEQDRSHRTVARYARVLIQAEMTHAKGNVLAEARQLEDRLGLSPGAMLRLEWEIRDVVPDDGAGADEPDEDDGKEQPPAGATTTDLGSWMSKRGLGG